MGCFSAAIFVFRLQVLSDRGQPYQRYRIRTKQHRPQYSPVDHYPATVDRNVHGYYSKRRGYNRTSSDNPRGEPCHDVLRSSSRCVAVARSFMYCVNRELLQIRFDEGFCEDFTFAFYYRVKRLFVTCYLEV